MSGWINIKGARQHNLKNIDVALPKNQLVVVTGPSGAGKSSLAFDTLYAEGQRRYVESLSPATRQFLTQLEKPDVDAIEGLGPAIAILQRAGSSSPRSTVGTVSDIHDFLRLLYARVAVLRDEVNWDKRRPGDLPFPYGNPLQSHHGAMSRDEMFVPLILAPLSALRGA